MEEWKLFKDLKQVTLFVSSLGHVKSISKKGKERQINLYRRGGKRRQYLSFGYRVEGKKILVQTHSAVAQLFLPTKPLDDDYQIDHIDDNSLNNKASNLRWLTSKENAIKGSNLRWKI